MLNAILSITSRDVTFFATGMVLVIAILAILAVAVAWSATGINRCRP